MLDLAFLHAANHLLDAAPWARERLAPFAGRRARMVLGALPIEFRIAADGGFESVGAGEPAVEIVLPATTPLALLAGRKSALSGARLSGDAGFAEALGFVLNNLEWDAEEDLSRVVGDIAARRIAKGAKTLATDTSAAGQRLMDNVAEYLRYERPAGVGRPEMAAFTAAVEALRLDAESLERRLRNLEGSVAAP